MSAETRMTTWMKRACWYTKYGPHIFHTNSEAVFTHLSRFTTWRPYEHRVLASVDNQLVPIPINLDTVNKLYALNLDAKGMEAFLAERVETPTLLRTSEDIVVSRVGRELYEKVLRNYTRKQWGLDPSQLDAAVAGRIPVRTDRDDRYFTDTFQFMPEHGYTRMFERMLDHPKITVRLGVEYQEVAKAYPHAKIVFTGPIDEYYGFRYGALPYRSLEFRHESHNREIFQQAPVVNYPNDHAYTRVTEFKYLTGQVTPRPASFMSTHGLKAIRTTRSPGRENAALYARYRELAERDSNVVFCGRLANYKYFNMDQVVAQALHTFKRMHEREAVATHFQPGSEVAAHEQPSDGTWHRPKDAPRRGCAALRRKLALWTVRPVTFRRRLYDANWPPVIASVRLASRMKRRMAGPSPSSTARPKMARTVTLCPGSYRRILANELWRKRLEKVYTGSGWIARAHDTKRAELDCCASSDALLMNVFCYPRVLWRGELCALLGTERGLAAEFGVRAELPMRRSEVDRTELDLRLGELLVESKLSETGFGTASRERLLRYLDVEDGVRYGSPACGESAVWPATSWYAERWRPTTAEAATCCCGTSAEPICASSGSAYWARFAARSAQPHGVAQLAGAFCSVAKDPAIVPGGKVRHPQRLSECLLSSLQSGA